MTFARSLFTTVALFALMPAWAQRPQGGWHGGTMPAIGRIYGRILDASDKKGVEFATVNVRTAQGDSVVGGALVEGNGDFSIDRLPVGLLNLRVVFIGYKTLEQQVTLTPDHAEQDLGNLLMQPDVVNLKEAEVVAERSQTQLQVDRRVYNVDKDLAVRGGTGVDVMKNVPGLSVDADNNVQLRNGSPQVMVDGRPTALTLDQIPADDIERVEVITNPSVVFDASSSGGIINVVLKKSTRPGYDGQVQASAGTNGRVGGNISLNVKDGPWAVTFSGNGNLTDNRTGTSTQRDLFTDGVRSSHFAQSGTSGNERTNYGGRLGVDYKVNNRSSASISGNVRGRAFDSDDELLYTEQDGAGTLTGQGGQLNNGTNSGTDMSVQGGFKHRTPVEGREWTTDLTYNRSRRTNSSDYNTTTFDGTGGAVPGGTRFQESTGYTNGDQFTWQFDMSDPRSERSKLEYGLRSNTRLEHSVIDVLAQSDTSALQRSSALSNDYRITDLVNAAYVNWTRKLSEHWGVQAGLRAEASWFQADIKDPGAPDGPLRRFSYQYPDGAKDITKALFPALYFSRKWEGTREFQINVSRKINRPNFFQVMPFIMFSDTRNVRIGNPALAPEFINLAEVNHLLPFKKNPRNNWLTSVFVRNTNNVITSFAYPSADDPQVLVNTFINGNDSWTYGWENTLKLELMKAVQLTLSGTAQYVEIGAGSGSTAIRNNGWQANGKANLNVKLPKDWSFQINGEYEGRRPQPQGYAIANGGVDVSVAKDFGKHWSAQVLVNDVFYTRLWGTVLDTPALYQETERRREMRYARLQLTWKFGEQDASLFRRRQTQRRDPGAGSSDPESY